MSNEHTPGPWVIRDITKTFVSISAKEHHSLVDTWMIDEGVTTEQMLANARLITAAPDLFEAAVEVEFNSEECLDFDECTAMLVPIDTYHKLMDAINKAKGL